MTLLKRYVEIMGAKSLGPVIGISSVAPAKYLVRLWDGMDGAWTDVTGPLLLEDALTEWFKRTKGGTVNVSFSKDIDYYRVFHSRSRMFWSGDREMFR